MSNPPTTLDGLAARCYVNGGMGIATRPKRDAVVQDILRPLRGSDGVSAAVRAQLAVEVLRGWVNHHEELPPRTLAWHRQFGAIQVQVGRAA